MAKLSTQKSYSVPSPYSYSRYSSGVPPIVTYITLFLVIASLGIGVYSIIGVTNIKKALAPQQQGVSLNDFLSRLTSNAELSSYKGINPINIVQINSNNLAQLQSQIQGLSEGHIGKFLVQYSDKIVLYDYAGNKIESQINLQQNQQPQLPTDFFAKLYAHPELSSLSGLNPVGGVLDEASISSLKQQFPDVYKDAKAGDALLRYPTALVIYDYNQDKIVNAVPLQEGNQQQ